MRKCWEDVGRSDRKGHFFMLTHSLPAAKAVFEIRSLQPVLQLAQDHWPIKNSDYLWIPLRGKQWLLFPPAFYCCFSFFVLMVALVFHKIFPPFFSGEDCVFLKAEGWIGPWQDPYLCLAGRMLCLNAHLLGYSTNIFHLWLWGRASEKDKENKVFCTVSSYSWIVSI